jgi:hypothetical protein
MPSQVKFTNDLAVRLKRLKDATRNLSEVLPALEKEMWEDNRDGLLASTDKDGKPLAPLAASTLKNRARGNGGPLVPRGRQSRFIANYRVGSIKLGDGNYKLIGAWQDVRSKKGVAFAGFHIEGAGRLPVRDIAGVRPTGKAKIQAKLKEWILGKWGGV